MPHLFPNLFPPPEIWDKIPPLSDPARKRGVRRELSILGVCGLIAASGVTVAAIEYERAKESSVTFTPDAVARDCVVRSIAVSGGAVILRISFDAPRLGEKTIVEQYGPVKSERTVTSSGKLGLFGAGLPEVYYGTDTDNGHEFTFTPARLRDGSRTYGVTLEHEYSLVGRIGPLGNEPAKHSSFADCGKVSVDMQHGIPVGVGFP